MLLYYLYQYDYVHKVYYNPFSLLFCYEPTIPLSRQINYPFLPLFYHFLPLNGKHQRILTLFNASNSLLEIWGIDEVKGYQR